MPPIYCQVWFHPLGSLFYCFTYFFGAINPYGYINIFSLSDGLRLYYFFKLLTCFCMSKNFLAIHFSFFFHCYFCHCQGNIGFWKNIHLRLSTVDSLCNSLKVWCGIMLTFFYLPTWIMCFGGPTIYILYCHQLSSLSGCGGILPLLLVPSGSGIWVSAIISLSNGCFRSLILLFKVAIFSRIVVSFLIII